MRAAKNTYDFVHGQESAAFLKQDLRHPCVARLGLLGQGHPHARAVRIEAYHRPSPLDGGSDEIEVLHATTAVRIWAGEEGWRITALAQGPLPKKSLLGVRNLQRQHTVADGLKWRQ